MFQHHEVGHSSRRPHKDTYIHSHTHRHGHTYSVRLICPRTNPYELFEHTDDVEFETLWS